MLIFGSADKDNFGAQFADNPVGNRRKPLREPPFSCPYRPRVDADDMISWSDPGGREPMLHGVRRSGFGLQPQFTARSAYAKRFQKREVAVRIMHSPFKGYDIRQKPSALAG